jgi:uncharacterized LabA/DUF88 family protein
MDKLAYVLDAKIPMHGRIALFIDVANILYSCQTLDWQIDYQKIFTYFKNNFQMKDAYFYSGIISKNSAQLKFFEKMREFGFKVKTKEVKWIKDNKSHSLKGKGNLDIELALDMTHLTHTYDTAILFSGDSDFVPAVEYVKKLDRKVVVISSRGHIARELIWSANAYIPFESLRELFERNEERKSF